MTEAAPLKISVILPCYNGAETVAQQLEALAHQQYAGSWEVIFVNNGSTDDSVAIAHQYLPCLPSLKIVDAYTPPGPRLGVAHSYNVGIQAASGDAFVFCEADDEVAPGWLAAMGQALTQYDFVAGSLAIDQINEPWVTALYHDRDQEQGLIQYQHPPYLPYARGCNLGIRRHAYQAAGPIDETIPCGWDPEYCWRVQLAGYPLHFVPDATIHYRLRHTLDGMYKQAVKWGEDHIYMRRCYEHPLPKFLTLKFTVWLLRHLPGFFRACPDRARFAAWLWQLGWRVGLVKGCFKYLANPPLPQATPPQHPLPLGVTP